MMRVGIVAAFDREAQMLSDRAGAAAGLSGGALVALAGQGPERARAAGQRLLDKGATALMSWGLAAGLDRALKPGSLLLPVAVLDAGLHPHPVDAAWHRELCAYLRGRFTIYTEPLAESELLLSTPAQKRALMLHSAAIAADMESAALAALAQAAHVPFVAVRAVSDTAAVRVPLWLDGVIDGAGRLCLGSVLRQILMRPLDWAAISHLALGFRAARTTLTGVARQLGVGTPAAA
jgi:adenosylhomocysteine nucleosidase